MAMSVIELKNTSKPDLLISENYNFTLKESIQNLISEIHNGNQNLSPFLVTFYELMQSRTDPHLETIWVYSSLVYRGLKISSEDISARVLAAKELFRLVSGCSASCSSSKCIALLAPVVFEVHKLVADLLGKDLYAKKVKKVVKAIKSLIQEILGYISLCCCKDLSSESESVSSLTVTFADLVSVWMDGKVDLESFLPLVSGEVRTEVSVGGCSLSYVAGIVIAEVVLLNLCFEFRFGNHGVELERELRSWVVASITNFRSFYLYETLVRLLLEPTLPVASFVSSEDEILLRAILYDADLLVEYSFLSPEQAIHIPPEHLRNLALKRLIIAHEAIELSRKAGNQKRAISYTSSFSNSQLPSQIIKFVTNQIGKKEEASRLSGSSPKAIIKWLLGVESEGIRLFDDSISKHRANLALDDSKSGYDEPESKPDGKRVDADLLFYIDNRGEEERDEDGKHINDSMSAVFLAAAHAMRLTKNAGRKRKEGISGGKRKRMKKDDQSDNSDSDRDTSFSKDSSNTESEVENPTSDEDA